MGSSRLPGKVLRELGGTSVLDYVVSRCKQIRGVSNVVVATTTLKMDDIIENWCHENDINCFRGSSENVLERYVECATLYKPDYIIRVTSDCPFLDIEMASETIELMTLSRKDILKIEGVLPRGLVTELISYDALLRVYEMASMDRHFEHVTYYAHENKNQFTWLSYSAPKFLQHPELRITLDTNEDYTLLSTIAQHFDNPLISSKEVVNYLINTPQIAKINAHIQQKPVI